MALENLTNNTLNSASKPKKRRNNSDLNESSNEIDTPVKKSKLDLNSTKNNNNNEHSSSLESITIISDDEDDNKSIEFEKKPNTNSDDIEVIELSDTEYECKSIEAISSKPITGLLKLEKTEKGQQKLTSVTMNNNNISEDNDIIIENPTTSHAASIQDNVVPYSNPSKIDKNDLKAQVAEGLNRQQTNRNYGFEEQIRSLIKPLLNTLESKPDPCQKFTDFVSPKSLKVKLMPHQIYSMHWLKWRESNVPYGAILADDMGLGKTLTTLAYLRMVKDNYEKKHKAEQESDEEKEKEEAKKENDENEDEDDKENDFDEIKFLKKLTNKKKKFKINDSSKKLKTLIVLPASLLHQWQGEIENKFEKNSFKIHVYHEADRKKNSQNLENNDIVFTTYEIISREVSVPDKEGFTPKSNTPLSKIKWKRIILDEAHRIKNHTTKANKAICTLKAKYRIALTGTPIHNSLNDLYSLVKFMNFDPLNDFSLWKYLFASETFSARTRNQVQSEEREKRVGTWLQLLADYLILRRTKLDKFPGTDKCIVNLPEKRVEEIRFKLGPNEEIIYQQIFNESKEKVNQFLDDHQKRLIANRIGLETGEGGSKKSSLTDIFVYLLRLRQACCHMSLLAECLDQEHIGNYDIDGDGSILLRSDGSSFNNHKNKDYEDLEEESSGDDDDDEDDDESSTNKKKEIISDGKDLEALNKIKSSDLLKCLEKSYMSSKIEKSLSIINELLNDFPKDKLIIVSQWTSMLGIIARQLKKQSIEYCEIKGEVSLAKRNEIVESFNDKSNTEQQVMLLSLCAGGVGLNLIGANRMFLLDIHWNPALEQQCADRIYRVGQTKNVTIYKLLCEETIEERIQQIQQAKIQIAERVCRSGAETSVPGAAGSTKLTISDFKLLFKDFGTK